MLRTSKTPACKNYADAESILDGDTSRVIGNNTRLEFNGKTIDLILHSSAVVKYYPNGDCELNNGGWMTKTTLARLNQFSPANVVQFKGNWYITSEAGTPFRNGIRVDQHGNVYQKQG